MAAFFCRRSLLRYKNSLFKTPYRTEFVVLIPETPENGGSPEEIWKCGMLPDLATASAKDCKTFFARKYQMFEVTSWELAEILKLKLDKNEEIDIRKHFLEPLETASIPFHTGTGMICTLYYANLNQMPTEVFSPMIKTSSRLKNQIFFYEPVYRACKKSLESEPDKFSDEEKRILQKFVWEGTLNGFHLDTKSNNVLVEKVRVREMRRSSYLEKWMGAMLNFNRFIYDRKLVEDYPSDFLSYASWNIGDSEKGPFQITLSSNTYDRFMEYCDSRQARLELWLSRRQICSKHGDQRFRADLEVEDIRDKKMDQANLLGYPTYAHMMVKTQMAESIENIQDMLSPLLEKAKIGQEAEIHELEKFANSRDFAGNLELWDVNYWGRLQKKELYHFDEIAMQEYFPMSQVLLGLFALCEQLFGIIIEEETENVNLWHPDVRYFHIFDENTKNLLGGFYLDPYARKGKRLSEDGCGVLYKLSSASKLCNTLPCATLVFFFLPPTEFRPSLLLFNQIEDLFYKFGAVLQHILTEAKYGEVSEMTNFEWEAWDVCSKFLAHWVYEPGTLESMSSHYNTGEPLPPHVLEGVWKMQHHLAGTKLSVQLYISHLDLQLHMEDEHCMPIVEKLWPEHFIFDLERRDHHPFGLRSIIYDSFGCTYYSRVWSSVIAADIFAAFQEAGFDNEAELEVLGRRLRSTFFAMGGACHPSELFMRFRGRNPQQLQYLQILGLAHLQPLVEDSSPEPRKIEA